MQSHQQHFLFNSLDDTIESLATTRDFYESGIDVIKVSKEAKIGNRFNQAPHRTQDTT